MPTKPAGDALVGRTLGDFVLRERFAAGGGGDVYLAEQITLGRQVVVKVVHQRGDAPQRFLREARLASRLDHPYVAHVYGFGAEDDGTLWMAMELVRGTPLDVIIRDEGALDPLHFLPLFERLCEVLHAAHEQGIVHRDIKPHNVMVIRRAGKLLPKLLDLGISRRLGKEEDLLERIEPPRPMNDTHDDASETITLEPKTKPKARSAKKTTAPAATIKASTPTTRKRPPARSSRTAKRLADSASATLTQVGQVMGTPHYIAPEQWGDAAHADVRSDLYSLAIVAYEALTGRLPYAHATTLDELIEAQRTRPLPPLPDALPPEVHDVLARGTAVRPEDRYASALELAAALRDAFGFSRETVVLPALPHELIDTFLHEAPQPIAEAVARIEAARTERQQHQAMQTATRVSIRWLVLVALACRARIAGATDSDELKRLVTKLAADGLDDGEWFALGAALTAPFRQTSRAHPLPELVAAFESPFVEAPTISTFTAWLRALLFVLDYPLLVDGERWMGTRRAARVAQPVANAPSREPVLVDAVGVVVVSLHPLIQVFAPSGGMADELFFLESKGRHGARLVAHPSPYELQSELPLPWLSGHLFDLQPSRRDVVRAEVVPYKGLATFGPEDAENFFGREREAESFANRLRLASFLAVVGPSGTGKSSFVLAGVLPLLPAGTEVVVLRPGASPKLPAWQGDRPRLVVVDQFEELITLCPDPAVREAFATALCAAATGETRVVITLRDDFLIRVQQLAAMRERLSRSLQLLATPAKDDLLRVLIEPARRVGYGFDDPELPAKMIDTVLDHPGALALLSFAASQLWRLRDRQTKLMRKKAYEAIGGVGGALGQHAEATLAMMSERERPLVREAFRHLVTAQHTRAVLTGSEMRQLLGDGAGPVIEKLVAARILVTSTDAQDRVEIIHEALIESWPRLAGWLREDAETARLRDSLRASARQWEERGQPNGLLWRKETLAEYKVWRARYPGRLTDSEEAFAAASLGDERRARRIRQALAATAFTGLSVALVLIFGAYREAKARFLALRQEQARLALLDTQPLKALAYLQDAVQNGADNPALRRMAGFVAWELQGAQGVVARHQNAAWKTAATHDGKRFATLTDDVNTVIWDAEPPRTIPTQAVCNEGAFTAKDTRLVLGCLDATARVFDPDKGTLVKTIALGDQPVWDVTAMPDDDRVLVAQPRFGVRMVSLSTGAISDVWRDPEAPPVRSDVDVTGKRIAVFSGSGTIDVKSLRGLWLFPDKTRLLPEVVVHDASFSPDGKRLLLGSNEGEVAIYDLEARRMLWQKALRPDKIISHAQFSPDGKLVLSNDAETTLFEADTGRVRWSVPPGGGALCWAPDSRRLFTGGGSGVLEARDVDTGDVVWRHHGHAGVLTHCRVTTDGNTVITTSESGTVRRWDARLRIDAVVAGIGKVRYLPSASAPSADPRVARSIAMTTADGLYLVDADGKAQPLVQEAVAESAVTTVDMADEGAIAWSIEDRLRVHDGKAVVSDVRLPGPIIYMSMNRQGTRVASFLLSAGAVIPSLREGKLLPKLVADDHVDISGLLFLDETTLATCNLNGDLRIWNVDATKLLVHKKAHSGQCSLEIAADGTFRTLSEDRGVVRWRWTGVLTELDRRTLPRTPRAFAPNRDDEVVTDSGHLTLLEGSLPIAELRIRGTNFPAASQRGGRYVYWDRVGHLSVLVPPTPMTDLKSLEELGRCRGLWELKADHITERTAEPSCP